MDADAAAFDAAALALEEAAFDAAAFALEEACLLQILIAVVAVLVYVFWGNNYC